MVKPGDKLTNRKGEQLVFLQTSGSTGGELVEMEVTYMPHSTPPPEHYHPEQDERFEVLAGQFRAEINGIEAAYDVGDVFEVPAGIPHLMHNVSDGTGRLNWQVRPALDTESFFETLWGLAQDGKTNPSGAPNLLQMALIGRKHAREFRLTKPPHRVTSILFALLTPFARLLGFQAYYVPESGAN